MTPPSLRLNDDPLNVRRDEGSEVYYILTDHLGSTSTVVYFDDFNVLHIKARQWYKPWGEVRQVTGEMPTDRTFTGQREHDALGMLWYNSRFFDASLGRFSQPDSLVPYPGFPLSFDRYNYVRNNPLKYIDPSGHMETCGEDKCGHRSMLVTFKAEPGQRWGKEKLTISKVVNDFAKNYANTYNQEAFLQWKTGESEEPMRRVTPKQAFLTVHQGSMQFIRKQASCDGQGGGCAGEAKGYRTIWVYSNAQEQYVVDHFGFIAHEIGHTINRATSRQAERVPPYLLRPLTEDGHIDDGNQANFYYGYAGGFEEWQYGYIPANRGSEEFADMAVGWNYNAWSSSPRGQDRADYINQAMTVILFNLIRP